MISRVAFSLGLAAMLVNGPFLAEPHAQTALPGTQALTLEGDLSRQMVAGIGRYFDREIARSEHGRAALWQPDYSSRNAYERSVQANRERLARMTGVVDPRVSHPDLEYVSTPSMPAKAAETAGFAAYAVRWTVFENVRGEGLLLEPKSPVIASVVAIPDADQLPEEIAGLKPGLAPDGQYARRLAENGCRVLIPTLVDRSATFSGSPLLDRHTNFPHREWIYRQAYFLGRHLIGYEVQKIRSALDWLSQRAPGNNTRLGVAGWGEGGLLALYCAALDTRIDSVLVSGYFGKRELLWTEPIYRNVFGLLREFGDAEIAQLIVPRSLIVEHARTPDVNGPPQIPGRSGAAPGRITTAEPSEVRSEIERARQLARGFASSIHLYPIKPAVATPPMTDAVLLPFLQSLSADLRALKSPGSAPSDLRIAFDFQERQRRQVRELEVHTQRLMQLAAGARQEFFWSKVTPASGKDWHGTMQPYRELFWDQNMGRLPTRELALNAHTRLVHDKPAWTAHEVVLDVLPDVFAWGYFLVPKGIKPGEKRPVVITQHGLEGLPEDTVTDDVTNRSYALYNAFAARLAERGFVVFAPHNPYRGSELFRVLQRKANPLGKTLFSVIIAQNEIILDWLAAQPNVDRERIGYYGLSYGGKSAMRVPAVLDRFAVSICSGDFNEWTWKNVSTDFSGSYMFNRGYEMPDFNLGMTFGYAEMAALIAPRPFMVERGRQDRVGIDEWVAYEFAKVEGLYSKLGIPNQTEIEYFEGPHTINGVGTFNFLHRHLKWPEPVDQKAKSDPVRQ